MVRRLGQALCGLFIMVDGPLPNDYRQWLSALRRGGLLAPVQILVIGGARPLKIDVVDNQIESALKALKKQMVKEGLFKDMKRRAFYEKPSVKRKRKQAEARRKRRKAERRAERRDD